MATKKGGRYARGRARKRKSDKEAVAAAQAAGELDDLRASAPDVELPPRTLACLKCGATAEAACDHGVAYVKPGERALLAVRLRPGMSIRDIAAEFNIPRETVRRARLELDQRGPSDPFGSVDLGDAVINRDDKPPPKPGKAKSVSLLLAQSVSRFCDRTGPKGDELAREPHADLDMLNHFRAIEGDLRDLADRFKEHIANLAPEVTEQQELAEYQEIRDVIAMKRRCAEILEQRHQITPLKH